MESGGARLSDIIASYRRGAAASPGLRHGSEDRNDPRSKSTRVSPPECPQVRRNEKPSVTREFSRSFPSQQSQIEDIPSRQSQSEEEFQHIEAEIAINPTDWELPEVINYVEKQGVQETRLAFCRDNDATGKWIEFYFNLPNIEKLLENEFFIEDYRERAKLMYKVKD